MYHGYMILDPSTGQWFVAGDGQRWWFDSGSIAFDFAYTGGFSGPSEWEYWHGPQDVAAWWRERFGVEISVSEADYERSRELRQMIAQAILAVSHGEDIPARVGATIDNWAACPDVAPQLRAEPSVSSDRLLATIARAAVVALRQAERVRVCGADDCAVMYLDTSRSGSRAWCSMQRCGNRHKVRKLRARRAASDTHKTKTEHPRQENDT